MEEQSRFYQKILNADNPEEYTIKAPPIRYMVDINEIKRKNERIEEEQIDSVASSIKPIIKNTGLYTDGGIDLFSCERKEVYPGKMETISTGLRFELPPNTVGLIFPRGGDIFLTGSGVIDSGYRGIVKVRVYNWTDDLMVFEPGSSIGQMVMVWSSLGGVNLDEVEEVETDTERGESGRINNV